MYAIFRKAKYAVRIDAVAAYLKWRLRQHEEPTREALRHIQSLRLSRSLPKELRSFRSDAMDLGVEDRWIHGWTDGTRIQVFDDRNNRICKITKDKIVSNGLPELVLRRSEHRNFPSPLILETDVERGAFVEAWSDDYVRPTGIPWHRCLETLFKYVYEPEFVTGAAFLRLINEYGTLQLEERGFLRRLMNTTPLADGVPIARAHGDLVLDNILTDEEGNPIFIDWEYSRRCLISYDIWLLIYTSRSHEEIARKGGWRSELLRALRTSWLQEWIPGVGGNAVRWLHPIHLLERLSLLRSVNPRGTRELRKRLLREFEECRAALN